jgi:hypothetical protein
MQALQQPEQDARCWPQVCPSSPRTCPVRATLSHGRHQQTATRYRANTCWFMPSILATSCLATPVPASLAGLIHRHACFIIGLLSIPPSVLRHPLEHCQPVCRCDGCGDQGVGPRLVAELPVRQWDAHHLRHAQCARRLRMCGFTFYVSSPCFRHARVLTAWPFRQHNTLAAKPCLNVKPVITCAVVPLKASTTAGTAWRVPTAACSAWGARWRAMSASAARRKANESPPVLPCMHGTLMQLISD